jgi:dienelactone hydrolase
VRHENRGLNPHIEDIAPSCAREILAFAPDAMAQAAQLAWTRTIAFFNEHLR